MPTKVNSKSSQKKPEEKNPDSFLVQMLLEAEKRSGLPRDRFSKLFMLSRTGFTDWLDRAQIAKIPFLRLLALARQQDQSLVDLARELLASQGIEEEWEDVLNPFPKTETSSVAMLRWLQHGASDRDVLEALEVVKLRFGWIVDQQTPQGSPMSVRSLLEETLRNAGFDPGRRSDVDCAFDRILSSEATEEVWLLLTRQKDRLVDDPFVLGEVARAISILRKTEYPRTIDLEEMNRSECNNHHPDRQHA